MKNASAFVGLQNQLSRFKPVHRIGRVTRAEGSTLHVSGLGNTAHIGDRALLSGQNHLRLSGEVVQLNDDGLVLLPDGEMDGVAIGDRVILQGAAEIAPHDGWIGRIVDPDGRPLDGKLLLEGVTARPLRAKPPLPAQRRALGARMNTGLAALNTVLPIVQGQRVGLFAGSGVGKSSLMGTLAKSMQADVVVIALIGERGRELRHFVDEVLGSEGLSRSVVIAATSDQSALIRRRCAWTAMAVAEHFRDQGKSVLFVADSITRFAEAHREVSVAAGEAPVLRGHPPSTAHLIMSLCERAGPGQGDQGDITGVFSVLVAGSDMDEPIADILRGVLDGHIVLDREIAERGRFPAIDVLRSVSRSLPAAASKAENETLAQMRRALSVYDRNTMMISAGLYTHGSDPDIDHAIKLWPELETFLAKSEPRSVANSFAQLNLILRRAKANTKTGIRGSATSGL
ncbi:FliI/YscN family ATPase [Pseudosulfitobacter sp. DSM 107133]|uniref:FliI/YscN family ATPase n=1 Tax=Pseudosulfitobacter sp. DSM 107133 TaxID=2883100 RepID=UPI000DF3A873|nr:FliI/YscN family ATPase [Pseudosulfitobacter sp. DSM 107133]UOA28826.1 Flagellum-specific ATP synthase [Pseudosulfitobacter sp. DSM 107133]